jgi:hypothetical protein
LQQIFQGETRLTTVWLDGSGILRLKKQRLAPKRLRLRLVRACRDWLLPKQQHPLVHSGRK